ncbi:hypothetical protein SO694_00035229 [Aureococcus anophagefferens]|uniref:PH domain-containing protein n=1 Tax=Aureococcus anophagefferens TaxID=44056 RepID=A0ABR1FKR3_AURAN
MVGKSIAVRGTRTAPPSRRRRAAWQRAAIIESYELANPAMIDSGDVDVLLAKYAGGLGRLLQRVQVKYDLVALDGCLMYRKAPGARWKEVSAELHARGRLALYRCDDDEARRALRALAAFGGAADGVALPTGVSVVGWVDARTLASATARDEDGGRYPFVVQAGGETGLAVTLAARTSNERGAWLAALREVASYFRDLRREAAKVRRAAALERRAVAESAAAQLQAEVARSVLRPRRSSKGSDREHDETNASRRSRGRWSSGPRATTWRGPATPSARSEAYDGAERAAAAVAGLARVADLDPSLLALVEGEAKAAAARRAGAAEAAPRRPAGHEARAARGGFVVLAVEGAGAAAAAGVRAGDVVVAVAGRSLAAEDWPEAGPRGRPSSSPGRSGWPSSGRAERASLADAAVDAAAGAAGDARARDPSEPSEPRSRAPSRASLADAAVEASGARGDDDADAADEPRASLASAASSEPEHEHRPSFFYREQAPAAAEPAPPPRRSGRPKEPEPRRVEALKNMPRDPEWGAQPRGAARARCGAPRAAEIDGGLAAAESRGGADGPRVRRRARRRGAARVAAAGARGGAPSAPRARYGHWERESHSIWRGSVLLDGPPSDADENSDWGDDAIADDDDAIGEPEDAGGTSPSTSARRRATHGGWSDVSSMPDDAEDELGRPSFAGRTLDITRRTLLRVIAAGAASC